MVSSLRLQLSPVCGANVEELFAFASLELLNTSELF